MSLNYVRLNNLNNLTAERESHMGLKIAEAEPPAKKVVGTQVSIELYERLKKEASDEFMSVSDLLRKLIILHFREKGEDA